MLLYIVHRCNFIPSTDFFNDVLNPSGMGLLTLEIAIAPFVFAIQNYTDPSGIFNH